MPPATTVTPKHLLHEGTPAEIRDMLIEEELPQFEADYAAALREAAETYSLDKLNGVMECWRRIACMTAAKGPEAHRQMLAMAAYINEHGKPPSGTVTYSADEIREQIRERMAAQV